MAGIKVDPPPVNMQIIDMKTGRPTRPFIEFMHRLWQRTGGEVDAIEDLDVTNSYPVFKPTSASDAEMGQPSFLEGQKGASEEQINEAIQNLSALVHAKAPQPDVLDAIESLRAVTLSDMAGLHSEIGELREHVESLITLVMIIERPGRAASDAVSNHVALPDPHSQYADQANTYTETEVDNLLDDKADKATTYTETEVDGLLNTKADKANTYTETEVDELTGSLAYPSTTLASSSDIPESVKTAIAAYPHIQGFRTGTGAALTFAQVVEEAAERGARLLTIQELEAGVCQGTGYSYDAEITWTSSPAGVGLVYGNIGAGDGTRVILNTSTDTAAGGYAVSVIGQRQWTDTQYAEIAGGAAANFAAMPQVGGDPIVESGSNADGEWTRWADGTQICTLQSAIVNSAEITWTYPVVFSAAQIYVGVEKTGGGTGQTNQTVMGGRTTSSVLLNLYDSDGVSNDSADITALATGRWK